MYTWNLYHSVKYYTISIYLLGSLFINILFIGVYIIEITHDTHGEVDIKNIILEKNEFPLNK